MTPIFLLSCRARSRSLAVAGLVLVTATAAVSAILVGNAGAADAPSTPERTRASFPDAAALPVRKEMPDPLVMLDGRRVTTAKAWMDERRPELKALFQHYMYGALPPRPAKMTFDVKGEYADALGGKATLKLVQIQCRDSKGAGPRIDLVLFLPNAQPGRVPVFLAMNFCGNHALTSDPRIPLTRGWLYDSCQGCEQNHATEKARGGQSADWPIEEILGRGYALASFCSSDIDSDRKDVSDGVYAWLAQQAGEKTAPPADRGTIAAWAWGFHRCVDGLDQERRIDTRRIAVVGHSRNGKTALLAAALDERIALAIPHQAGCGGTAPNRGHVGESVKRINDSFPHWFNAEFKKFNEEPDRLPFDQNGLVALCAPRPVLFSNAVEDQWANPAGQFEVLQAADPVYRFLKVDGLDAKAMPEPGRLVKSRLGYFIRPGKHSMTTQDWRVFLEFADAQLRGAR